MERIMIIGSGGAGKSTMARELGQKLNLPVFHLDVVNWRPNWEIVPREQQIEIQKELVKQEKWIIDGNYGGTMDIRLERADTIIFLDFPRTLCLYRAIKRRFQYRNKTRPDMREGNKERFDLEFYKWIWNFPKIQRPKIMEILSGLSTDKKVVVLRSPKDMKHFLTQIKGEE